MKFTALNVNGDSFLLESSQHKILVDGGQGKKVLEILTAKGVDKLDLLVCTHYDSDHLGGVKAILQTKDIKVDEIWLPEIIGLVSKNIVDNIHTSLKEKTFPLESTHNLLGTLHKMDFDNLEEDLLSTNTAKENKFREQENIIEIEEMGDFKTTPYEVWAEYLEDNLYHYYRYGLHRTFFEEDVQAHLKFSLLLQSKSYTELLYLLKTKGCNVLWYKYGETRKLTPKYGIIPINSAPVKITKLSFDKMFKLMYLSKINRESLVFKFSEENSPDVLFTADSDLKFVSSNNSISLRSNSIVTAPHHGSKNNDDAYSVINRGSTNLNDLYFVRGHNYLVTMGQNFFKQKNKFCTKCGVDSKNVILEFKNNNLIKATPSVCKNTSCPYLN